MGAVKRRLNGDASNHDDDSHSARKRRRDYTQADADLAKIYNDLADDVQTIRLKAAGDLVKNLSATSDQQHYRIDAALNRLVKGLCSGRKAARLGFSIALAELLRVAVKLDPTSFSLTSITQRVIQSTTVEGNVSGQERRDAFLGRRFAFQSILQSNLPSLAQTPAKDWRDFLDAFTALASERQWLRRECGAVLHDYLISADGKALAADRIQSIVDAWGGKNLWKTPEGVAIWLTLSERDDAMKLPKHIWQNRNPLSSKERAALAKVMQEVPVDDELAQQNKSNKSGSRQAAPSFAWSVVLNEFCSQDSSKDFSKFWVDVVENGLFSASSSAERKALGLQIVTVAISTVPRPFLAHVLQPGIVRCILNQRSASERYLFEAAKTPLSQIIARTKLEPSSAGLLLASLLKYGAVNFDHSSKTKTVETVAAHADDEALSHLIEKMHDIIRHPGSSESAEADSQRRLLVDLLLSIIRSKRDPHSFFLEGVQVRQKATSLKPWLNELFDIFVTISYGGSPNTAGYTPAYLESLKPTVRSRLMSCLGHTLTFPISEAIKAPLSVFWKSRKLMRSESNQEPNGSLVRAEAAIETTLKTANRATEDSDKASAQALVLLLSMSAIQVLNEEPDALSVLDDLLASVESWDNSNESRTMLVELLLSFISKPSALFRKLAEQVFEAFASSLTADGLQSMLDILEQKESLSGQQALFDQHDDDEANDSDEDGEAVDIDDDDDDSDVEIVNGVVAGANEEDEEEDSDEDDSSESDASESDGQASAGDEDEEAAFDRKLADALGTAKATEEDEDEHGSDMDDEQMMALEPHLTSIFKERKKTTTSKQDNKDARENIINFKNRVLDLLAIYVKTEYANTLAVDLILPLTVLVRTTNGKATGEKAFSVLKQYIDAFNKNKTEPPFDESETLFDLLTAVHLEVTLGGSKLHANACSRASLFLAKMLVTLDVENYKRVAEMYSELQSTWYLDPGSKIQGSIFTEWTSWSMTTRKQR